VQVVKLDIDNVELEMAFMKEVLEDAQLRSLISEMMFEMHYSHRWGAQPTAAHRWLATAHQRTNWRLQQSTAAAVPAKR
jgi:hypothetical protein